MLILQMTIQIDELIKMIDAEPDDHRDRGAQYVMAQWCEQRNNDFDLDDENSFAQQPTMVRTMPLCCCCCIVVSMM